MRKIIAAATAALLALGGVALAAAPASAHTGKVSGVAACEPDGTYSVTWTYNATNVPSGKEAETKAMTTNVGSLSPIDGVSKGGQVFLSVWSEHQINVPGAPVKTGNWSGQFKTVGIPGTYVGDVTTMVQTDWKDGPSEDPVGKVRVDGTCSTPIPEKPADLVTYTEWVDGTWACGDTAVTQSRSKSVTTYVLVGREWVAQAPVVTPETQVRNLTPEEVKQAQSTDPSGECFVPPTNTCTAYGSGPTSTNLVPLWSNVDTRSSGHYEYIEDGLHVWTDDATSQAKVSLGYPASFALANTGVLDLAWSGSTPPPGINLFVNFGADGSGTLVYESVYGQDLWLTNGSSAAVKANAPVNGGGNGSQWHGTIDQWLAKYPEAQVVGIAFSLGSGVKGDGAISSITAGCTTYTFDYVEPAPKPEPVVEHKTVSTTDCEAGTVMTTPYTRTESEPTFDPVTNTWTRGEFGDWVAGEPTVREATAEECPVSPTPTPTPTDSTPNPTPTTTPEPVGGFDTLATTGSDGLATVGWLTGGALAVALGALLTVLGIHRRRARQD